MFSLMIICRIRLSVNLIQTGLSPEAEKTGQGSNVNHDSSLCRHDPRAFVTQPGVDCWLKME